MNQISLMPGDNRLSLATIPDNSIDSCVCDPPYGLVSITKRFGKEGSAPARKEKNDGSFARLSGGFMAAKWDSTGIERDPTFWAEVLRVLKPGAYIVAFSSSRTYHRMATAIEDAGFVTHPMIGWCYGCLDTETECLTRRGWLSYTELLPTDEVMQWDSLTDSLSWVVPEQVHEYDFDGQMVQIKNRHTHQVLTPNHRVYAKVRRHSRHPKPTSFEVIDASDVQSRPSNWHVDLPMASVLYQSECVVDPTFAYLVGWWLTDAWSHKDANACCFSQSKPATLAKLRVALGGLGASEYVKPAKKPTHNDEHTFYLTGPMADRLRTEFPDRILGWHVLGWTLAARQALYDGLMDGDGSRGENGQIAEVFWSKKKERRDVFLALALSIGIRCYEDSVKGAVYVNPKTRTTQVQGKHRDAPVNYKGKVWCLTVPTGAFVARRCGRPFITGNSGFPKAHAADKAIDKLLGKPGQIVPAGAPVKRMIPGADQNKAGWEKNNGREYQPGSYMPATDEAAEWQGWAYGGQVRKPALEPIYVGQKPFSEKSGAANILRWGVGAVNIDGCRVPVSEGDNLGGGRTSGTVKAGNDGWNRPYMDDPEYMTRLAEESKARVAKAEASGRHPANLIHDGSPEVVALFPDSKGQQAAVRGDEPSGVTKDIYGKFKGRVPALVRNDSGSAARFFESYPFDGEPIFYHPKAGKEDRAVQFLEAGQQGHPTVKPVALMQALIRHVTPPGGTVLDPFAGSGTTGEAALREGFDCILMEAESEYVEFLGRRFAGSLESPRQEVIHSSILEYVELLGVRVDR